MAELAVLAATAASSFATSGAGTILSLVGTGVAAAGALQQGAAANAGAQFEARQMEMKAQEARAVAQREAMATRRKTELTQSSLQARAASSGGTATDAGVLDLAEGIEEQGEYGALTAMAAGENRARGLEDSAMGRRASGEAAQTGSYFRAGSSLLSGIGSLSRYDRRSSPAYG